MAEFDPLLAVSPVDGRYRNRVQPLVPITSESGLIKYRVGVELAWIGTLTNIVMADTYQGDSALTAELDQIYDNFDLDDARRVKELEKTSDHDVKAAENYLREEFAKSERLRTLTELLHIFTTSEDTNNLAYAMMIRDIRDKVYVPEVVDIETDLLEKAEEFADIPLLALTHGQPASPTTLGKEMMVFAERTTRHLDRLGSLAIKGKFNGASGNYNSFKTVLPEVNWPEVNRRFVESLGFEFNDVTTQIEPHDWMVTFFNETAAGNSIFMDVAQDIWGYISRGVFKQIADPNATGSSTMPHKVNPIDFEGAWGNFLASNATLRMLATELPISRFQRDLKDSTLQRNIGPAYGNALIAHKALQKGLAKIEPNHEAVAEELQPQWAVLTEAVQTEMRKLGIPDAFKAVKELTRGKTLDQRGYYLLVIGLDLPKESTAKLLELTPETYLGYAPEIARGEV